MTPADLVAEALAKAEETTPTLLDGHYRVSVEDVCGDAQDLLDSVSETRERTWPSAAGNYPFVRRDVVDAALAHVAERLAEAEERATRLSAALDQVVEMTQGDMDLFDRAYGVAHNAQRACGACFGKKDKVAAHG